jgi:CheY-like chemotaxis protein
VTVSILVVDDESDVAELYRQRFRREVRQGTYAMHFANSGEDALDKLDGGVEPNLIAILSDINMPGMDGLDLLGEIKTALPGDAGDDGNRLWRRRAPAPAEVLGAAEFLTKPVDFALLKVRLRQLPSAAD